MTGEGGRLIAALKRTFEGTEETFFVIAKKCIYRFCFCCCGNYTKCLNYVLLYVRRVIGASFVFEFALPESSISRRFRHLQRALLLRPGARNRKLQRTNVIIKWFLLNFSSLFAGRSIKAPLWGRSSIT